MKALLPPLPVLAIESLEQFEKIFDQLIASLKCQDMVEMIHIRDFAFAAWEEARYTRHRVVAFDRVADHCARAEDNRPETAATA
jgi:hypothetical protein